MTMVAQVAGKGIPVRGDDIDTDRIIPARYLKEITFENMGKYAFYDARFKGGSILVVNRNFGCGSSREHAPQALMRFGIKAIVGESFAEIFAGNCQLLGVPCVTADPQEVKALQDFIEADGPQAIININLEESNLSYADESIQIIIPEARRRNLLAGSWNTLNLLVSGLEKTREKAAEIPYIGGFSGKV